VVHELLGECASPAVESFDLVPNADDVMPSLGHMAVLDTIYFM
jgi:hypothetical protein